MIAQNHAQIMQIDFPRLQVIGTELGTTLQLP